MGKGLCLSHTAKLISYSDSSIGKVSLPVLPGSRTETCEPESLGSSPSICKALNPPFLPFFCDLIGLVTLPCLTLGAVGLINVQKVLKMLGCKFCFQCFHSGFRKGPSY